MITDNYDAIGDIHGHTKELAHRRLCLLVVELLATANVQPLIALEIHVLLASQEQDANLVVAAVLLTETLPAELMD